MPVVRLAVAACVLLVLTACGAGNGAEGIRQSFGSAAPTAPPAPRDEQQDERAPEGSKSLGNGVWLTISEPKSFTPTDTAYPRSARAAAFDLRIENKSDTIYRPAQLSFVATADGVAADQVIDSTQGYTGVVGAVTEVLPNQALLLSVAFGVPDRPCVMRVAVQPSSTSANAIPIFDGTV